MTEPRCRCGTPLTDETWHESKRKRNAWVCKTCVKEQVRAWKAKNTRGLKKQRKKQYETRVRANPAKTRGRIAAMRAEANYLEGLLNATEATTV